MAFRIATNVASLNTQRWLSVANTGMSKALERLSSGYKINKAADDAAGIAIATKLNVKAISVSKAIDNGNQAIAMLQTAESGIDQIKNILTRLKELATQAASDNTSTDRATLDEERKQLEAEIDKIANNTKYGATQLLKGANSISSYGASITPGNGISSIDVTNASIATTTTFTLTVTSGSSTVTLTLTNESTTQTVTITKPTDLDTAVANFSNLGIKVTINSSITDISSNNEFEVAVGASSFTYQVGDTNDVNDQISISIKNFLTSSSDVLNLTGGDISTKSGAQSYLTTIDTAITKLNTERGAIGAAQNQISYHIANLEAMYENTKAAESTIKDADFAAEMANFTKFQIVTQSGIAMLAQANQLPQLILSLMR